MAEDAHDTETIKKDAKEASLPEDIESQIKTAMRSRVAYFKEQADSFTFESVRRLLEKDLGLETLALDVHKRFVKQCLLECFDGKDDGNASKNSGEKVDTNVSTTLEVAGSPKGRQPKKEVKEQCSEDEEKMEDSPVFGLLSGHKTAKTESNKTEHEETKEVSEGEIKKAIRKRASYVIANSDKVTMAGLRRLLEEDMKLDKHTLDSYKKFISEQLDEVLKSGEVSAPASETTKNLKKDSWNKASRKSSTKKSSNSSGDEEEEEEEEEEEDEDENDDEEEEEEEEKKPKRKLVSKGRSKNSEEHKKRKKPEKETRAPSKKKIKAMEKVSENDSGAEDGGVVSEDSRSQSSAEKVVKRKEASTPVYGKRVEHLKSVIKSCAMSVPPAIYKKAKQAPENKREAILIKELEGILSKEGLSPNPTDKEIKEVRKRKERAKELEGIDTSNIVSNSRRRSTTSFIPPPKPKITDASDDDDTEDTDDDDNDDDGDNDEEEDGGDEGDDESQSEDSNDEEDEDSD